jgi:hypothetical protein
MQFISELGSKSTQALFLGTQSGSKLLLKLLNCNPRRESWNSFLHEQ